MIPVAWLLVAALVQSGEARLPDLEVRAAGGAVTVHARNRPLSQILDRLSSATGMELTYEGTRPSALVTVSVDNVSQTEAVLRLMEGLGISYVLRTDPTGERVDLLIVSGAGASTQVAASQPPPGDAYEEPVGDYGTIPLDPAALEAAGGPTRPDPSNPYLGLPTNLFPQAAPGYQPPPPMESPTASSGSRNTPAAPSFPHGASYPSR